MRWSLRFPRRRKLNAAHHDDFRIDSPRNHKHLLGVTVIYGFEKLTSSYKLGSPPLVRGTAPISNVPTSEHSQAWWVVVIYPWCGDDIRQGKKIIRGECASNQRYEVNRVFYFCTHFIGTLQASFSRAFGGDCLPGWLGHNSNIWISFILWIIEK